MEPGSKIRCVDPYSGRKFVISFPRKWGQANADCDGFYSVERRMISVRPGLSEDRMRSIVFHELVHLACSGPVASPKEGEKGLEELIVLTLEASLYPILRRNPRLTNWLFPGTV